MAKNDFYKTFQVEIKLFELEFICNQEKLKQNSLFLETDPKIELLLKITVLTEFY
jgi:hypothetical protein